MAEIETIGIFDEIQALVSDKLQVVSYKWLSRNFLVSSNDAKRLLQDFVEKHGAGLEVVYSLSGWLKNDPSVYHISLVSKPKLPEAKKEFDENCSVQVYSVQACLPKDPAVLWNAEFVQAEELFRQPPAVDNCLRDNRFCGVSNSFVKRNAGGTHAITAISQVKSAGVIGPSRNASGHQSPTLPQPEQKKVQQLNPSVLFHSPNVVKDQSNGNQSAGFHEGNGKPVEDLEKIPQLPANKKKVTNDKNSSGSGGVLANMWGLASTKSKGECASAKTNAALPNSAGSADTQICARKEIEHESSDDDGRAVNFRRVNNGEAIRKRRVVFDFSDEEDEYKDAVNLASPDPPKKELVQHSKQKSNSSDLEKNKLIFEEEEEGKTNVKERKETERETNQMLREESAALSEGIHAKASSSEKNVSNVSAIDTNVKDKVTDVAPKSPKRRKVLKTRIDERGREVTEVVWEGGEDIDTKPDCNTMKKVDNNSISNAANRPSEVKKSPAVGSNALVNRVGKARNMKTGIKDPKQGNILSFFKKV